MGWVSIILVETKCNIGYCFRLEWVLELMASHSTMCGRIYPHPRTWETLGQELLTWDPAMLQMLALLRCRLLLPLSWAWEGWEVLLEEQAIWDPVQAWEEVVEWEG